MTHAFTSEDMKFFICLKLTCGGVLIKKNNGAVVYKSSSVEEDLSLPLSLIRNKYNADKNC